MAKEKKPKLSLRGLPVAAVAAQLNAKYGANTLIQASKAFGLTIKFLSTGSYALDFACGGGIPENRITELRGKFSTLKTTICLRAIANFQQRYPQGAAFFQDGEKSFDPAYAKRLGVDLERCYIINSDSGEQAVNVLADLLDLGYPVLAVVDSIASLVPSAELEAEMEQQFQGLHPRLVNRMMRILTGGLKRVMYDSKAATVTVITTNQMREKIGVVYGSPETSPGGLGREHAYSLMVKFLSSPSDRLMVKVVQNGVEREVRYGQKVRFTVSKNKVSGTQFEEGEFTFFIRELEGKKQFTFDNEEVLLKFGLFFGLIKLHPPSAGRKKSSYSYLPHIDQCAEDLMLKKMRGSAKACAALYTDVLAEIHKENSIAVAEDVPDVDEEDEDEEPVRVVKHNVIRVGRA